MSSTYIRTQIKSFLSSKSAEKFVDLSGSFGTLKEFLAHNGVTGLNPWVGLEFIGDIEEPRTLNSGNTVGGYKETGAVYVHVVDVAKLGIGSSILTRAEALRNLFRGQRIGEILIDTVSPPNFDDGGSLNFDDGYIAASFLVGYDRNFNL